VLKRWARLAAGATPTVLRAAAARSSRRSRLSSECLWWRPCWSGSCSPTRNQDRGSRASARPSRFRARRACRWRRHRRRRLRARR